ncbi:hypothetical protein Tfer_0799 [Thermincola ferriacetica]|uniref:SHOCT domain-containing protein n=1 Tax=Thermincola ferriacetica TaxID=281456 RepID=A0A0L6W504_9FIRM|nr:hypothetical protein [Thermincola ferriacetica]KNZ70615.1 hypothetical protein Tfer_0799 [Thermincola ferriacetica]
MQRIFKTLIRPVVTSVLVLVTVLSFIPAAAWAGDEQMEFKNLKVSVWPEYDDPRVLVILEGTMVNASDSPFKGEVKWNIPKGKDLEIGMACEIVNGGHSCQPYEQKDKGDWIELTWKTTRSIAPGEEYPVFLEYYYNPIEGSVDKKFTFSYQPSYKIDSLTVSVQQPLKAENFKIDPAPSSTNTDSGGFVNHNYVYSNQTPNNKITLNVSYKKADPKPSVEKQVNNNNNGGEQQASGVQFTSSFKDAKIWVPAGFMVLILGGFISYAVMQNKDKQRADRIDRLAKKAVKANRTKGAKNPLLVEEKKKLRQQLLDGAISEETYLRLLADLEEEYEE